MSRFGTSQDPVATPEQLEYIKQWQAQQSQQDPPATAEQLQQIQQWQTQRLAPAREAAKKLNMSDRRGTLGVLRALPKEQWPDLLYAVHEGVQKQPAGYAKRLGKGLASGTAAFSQALAELVGFGGTEEEIGFIKQLESAHRGELYPQGSSVLANAPIQAAEMAAPAVVAVGGGGLAGGLARAAGVGATGAAVAANAGITAGMFPQEYRQAVSELSNAGVDPKIVKPIAVAVGLVSSSLEGFVPNPFRGNAVLGQGVKKAVTSHLMSVARNLPGEMSEEFLQSLVHEGGAAAATWMDENAPDVPFDASSFGRSLEDATSTGPALAVMMGVPAVAQIPSVARAGRAPAAAQEAAPVAQPVKPPPPAPVAAPEPVHETPSYAPEVTAASEIVKIPAGALGTQYYAAKQAIANGAPKPVWFDAVDRLRSTDKHRDWRGIHREVATGSRFADAEPDLAAQEQAKQDEIAQAFQQRRFENADVEAKQLASEGWKPLPEGETAPPAFETLTGEFGQQYYRLRRGGQKRAEPRTPDQQKPGPARHVEAVPGPEGETGEAEGGQVSAPAGAVRSVPDGGQAEGALAVADTASVTDDLPELDELQQAIINRAEYELGRFSTKRAREKLSHDIEQAKLGDENAWQALEKYRKDAEQVLSKRRAAAELPAKLEAVRALPEWIQSLSDDDAVAAYVAIGGSVETAPVDARLALGGSFGNAAPKPVGEAEPIVSDAGKAAEPAALTRESLEAMSPAEVEAIWRESGRKGFAPMKATMIRQIVGESLPEPKKKSLEGAVTVSERPARGKMFGPKVEDKVEEQSAMEAVESPPVPPPAADAASEKPKEDFKVQTISGKMDLDEFEAKGYSPNEVTRQEWVDLQRANRRKLGQSEEAGTQYAPYADYEEYHRDDVKRALKRGEEVDDRVMADYPDLKPPQAPETPVPAETASESPAAPETQQQASQEPAVEEEWEDKKIRRERNERLDAAIESVASDPFMATMKQLLDARLGLDRRLSQMTENGVDKDVISSTKAERDVVQAEIRNREESLQAPLAAPVADTVTVNEGVEPKQAPADVDSTKALLPILERQVGNETTPRRKLQAAVSVMDKESPAVQKALVERLREIAPDAVEVAVSGEVAVPIGMRELFREAPKSEPETPLQRQYQAAKAAAPDSLVLMRVGDFYEAYGDDAKLLADAAGIAITKQGGREMAGFPSQSLDRYLPRLVAKGLRVAVADNAKEAPEPAPIISGDAGVGAALRIDSPKKKRIGRPVTKSVVQEMFPGGLVTPGENGWHVEIGDSYVTIEFVDDLKLNKDAIEARLGRPLTDSEFKVIEKNGAAAAFSLNLPDGTRHPGLGLIRLVEGEADDRKLIHEAIHMARRAGLIGEAEWAALEKEHVVDGVPGDVEEQVAIGMERALKIGEPVPILERVRSWVRRLLAKVGLGPLESRDVYTLMQSAGFWARATTSTDAVSGEQYALRDRTYGRPELANPGDTAASRNFMDKIDEERKQAGEPGKVTNKETRAAAELMLEQDYRGTKDRLYAEIKAGRGLNAAETAAAQMIYRREFPAALRSGTAKAMDEIAEWAKAYREARTEAGRRLQIGVDEYESPAERAARLMSMAVSDLRQSTTRHATSRTLGKVLTGQSPKTTAEADAIWEKRYNELKAKLKLLGVDLDNLNEAGYSRQKAAEVLAVIKRLDAKTSDKWYEYWRNAILSHPLTQIANASGNMLHAGWHFTAEQIAETVVNQIPYIKTPTGAQPGELKWIAYGVLSGVPRGARNFLTTWKTETPTLEYEIGRVGQFRWEEPNTAISGKAGKVVRWPQRLLGAVDDFCKSVFVEMEAGKFAYRQATLEGKTGEERAIRTAQLVGDINSDAWKKAYDVTLELAFQQKGGYATSKAKEHTLAFRRDLPGVRYLFPFVTTPVNIFATGLKKSPLGTLNLAEKMYRNWQNGERPSSGLTPEMAQQVIAWAMVLAFMDWTDPDDPWITGAASEYNSQSREVGYRTYPSQSVRFGGEWHSYARIEPFATSIGMTIDWINAFRSGDAEKMANTPLTSLVGQAKNKTFLAGMSDILKALESDSPTEGTAKWGSGFAASWIPNVARGSLREADETYPNRRVWGNSAEWWERLGRRTLQKTELPGIPDQPIYDVWGRPATRSEVRVGSDWLYRMLVPVKKQTADMFVADRLIVNYNNQNPDDEQFPLTPSPYYRKGGETVYMTDGQYADYTRLSGEASVAGLTGGPVKLDADNPTAAAVEWINDVSSEARGKVRETLIAKWGGASAEVDPEALGKAAAAAVMGRWAYAVASDTKYGNDAQAATRRLSELGADPRAAAAALSVKLRGMKRSASSNREWQRRLLQRLNFAKTSDNLSVNG